MFVLPTPPFPLVTATTRTFTQAAACADEVLAACGASPSEKTIWRSRVA